MQLRQLLALGGVAFNGAHAGACKAKPPSGYTGLAPTTLLTVTTTSTPLPVNSSTAATPHSDTTPVIVETPTPISLTTSTESSTTPVSTTPISTSSNSYSQNSTSLQTPSTPTTTSTPSSLYTPTSSTPATTLTTTHFTPSPITPTPTPATTEASSTETSSTTTPAIILPDTTSTTSTAPATTTTEAVAEVFTGGFATWYTQNGNRGACGYLHSDYDLIVALDVRRYGYDMSRPSPDCGRRVRITNTNNGRTVEATIADACPTCMNENALDLSLGAFDALAERAEGMVPITWQFI